MTDSIITYINTNVGNLVSSGIYCIVGAILGIVLAVFFTPKDNNSNRNNGTSFQQTIILVKQTIINQTINNNHETKSSKPLKKQTTSSDENPLVFLLVIACILVGFYAKYHTLLLSVLVYFTFLTLVAIITISLILYKNNNLDKLNGYWILFMFIIIVMNFISIVLVSNQNVTLGHSIYNWGNLLYYAIGYIFLVIPNIFMLVLLIHLFALNSFLARNDKISYFFIRHTQPLLNAPKGISFAITIICILSLLLSSGIAYNFIQQHNKANIDKLTNSLK